MPTSSSRQGRASSIQLSADWRYSRPSARPWPTLRASSKKRSGSKPPPLRRRRFPDFAHAAASRAAVSRTSAIMLGTPWVRLDDSSRVRLNGSSSAADVGCRDLGRRPVLHRGQDQRDDALGDRGIAVGEEMQPAVGQARRIDPGRRRAAAHLGRVGLERVGHRLELAAQVDQQPIAILAVEELIFLGDVGNGGEGGHARHLGARRTPSASVSGRAIPRSGATACFPFRP